MTETLDAVASKKKDRPGPSAGVVDSWLRADFRPWRRPRRAARTLPVHYLDLSPEVGRTTVVQHQKIVKAIAARDPDQAEAAIVEHLTYLREHILAYRAK